MKPIFKSTRAKLFAMAKHGSLISHIEVCRAEFEEVIGAMERETGMRLAANALEFMANGVIVKCVDPLSNTPSPH